MTEIIFENISSFSQLRKSAYRAKKGLRTSKSMAMFFVDLEQNLLQLQDELVQQNYRPQPFFDFFIQDPKPRKIRAAPFRDRVVHHSLCRSLEPSIESHMLPNSFACRKGKGTHKAIHQAHAYCKNYPYFVKIDIRHCFENIYHPHLFSKMEELFPVDIATQDLIQVIVRHGAESENRGLPIGNLTSQIFANYVLHDLDLLLESHCQNHHKNLQSPKIAWIRYMDDILYFGHCKKEMRNIFFELQHLIENILHQRLKYEDFLFAPVSAGVPFLGFRFSKHSIRLDKSRKRRFLTQTRKLHRKINDVHNEKFCLEMQKKHIQSLQSRLAWISHADTLGLRNMVFGRQDLL